MKRKGKVDLDLQLEEVAKRVRPHAGFTYTALPTNCDSNNACWPICDCCSDQAE